MDFIEEFTTYLMLEIEQPEQIQATCNDRVLYLSPCNEYMLETMSGISSIAMRTSSPVSMN